MPNRVVSVSALLLIAAAIGLAQQISGYISGSVRDTSGASISAADVKLTSATTGAERQTRTDDSGNFVFTSVSPGQYRLVAQAPGFKTAERKGVVLSASERLSVGVLSLEIGSLEERVTVTAEGAAVQTASAERAASITGTQVENLLIYGRSVASLVALAPGVVDPTGAAARDIGGGSATSFNVLGNRANANNFTVDGVTMSAVGGAANGTFGISAEAVAEVKILISNYSAEYGRLAGSNVEMVTKSGSRQFHGAGMYYKRHEQFNANSFFNKFVGLPKSINRFNTYSYNVGGPVFIPGKFNPNRDKLFFFWNHEYTPRKSSSAVQRVTTPSALERAGDFSESVDVNGRLIPVTDPTNRQPFAGNKIPANRLDSNGQAALNFFPLPNFLNTAVSKGQYNYITQWGGSNPLQLFNIKPDYYISSKDVLSASINAQFSSNNSPNGAQMTAQFPVFFSKTSSKGGMVSIHHRHIFSPTLVNELMVGYAYTFGPPSWDDAGIKGLQRSTYGFNAGALTPANNPLNLMPVMSFGGVVGAASLGYDGRFPFNGARNVYNISDNVSKTLGAHTLKAGVFFERMRQRDGPWANNFTGNFDFGRNVNNPLDSGYAYANAILGVFNSYTEASAHPVSRIYSRGVDFFLQDTWKISRKLTLDYGARFAWFEPFWNFNDELAGFVPSRYDPAKRVQLIRPALNNGVRAGQNPVTGEFYSTALIGFIAPGSGDPTNGMVVTSVDKSYPRGLTKNSGILPAPRIGFAYDPFGDGKTAIRGGFGMFYSRVLGNTAGAPTNVFSYPLVKYPVVQFGTISTFRSAQGFTSPPAVTGWDRDLKTATIMNMSLVVQRNIGHGTVVDVGYVGSLGRHLSWLRSLQDIPLGTRFLPANADPTNTRVPLPDAFLRPIVGYNGVSINEDNSSSNYHSLQVTANRRFARNLEFGLAWTWSKALDYNDGDFGAINTVAPLREWNYGLAGFDRTHVVKINWLWSVPSRHWNFKPAGAVLNGWQISGITTFQSGAPVNVGFSQVNAADLSGTPSISPRILVVGDPVLPKGDRTFSRNFRTDVFRLPAAGTLGFMSKNMLRGPGINNWDIALFKNFAIREGMRVQFRSEFYNAFNHTQFSAFDSTARFDANGNQVNAQFGQFTAARDPRILQLAIRLQF
ncbi:MAG TPA: carboxypeptidase regulatory-like domain-containing protein [Bryobacteraceae bacterium]|nr:carboxypeptidase regulatory-like domain-containing protein [Bryobacteraceae bacterium]